MNPFFTICIAAFNADFYLDDCLRSIAAQDCSDFEVVIVDDGSAVPLILDEGIAESLSAVRVERISNSGPYAARQKAFDLAKGEVLVCVDSDDKLFDCSMLTKLKSVFINHEVDVVFYNATCDERRPARFLSLSSLGEGGSVEKDAVWRVYTKGYSLNSLWCKAFKRTLYTKGNKARPRLLMAEDRLQSLEIMRNARSYWLIDEPMYFYRSNPASTTNGGYRPTYFHQTCYVEGEVLTFISERGIPVDGWAAHFLSSASGALLGLRYNSTLSRDERWAAYEAIGQERVLDVAMGLRNECGLSFVDDLRLSLMEEKKFRLLDISMLPWKAGSVLKHLADSVRLKGR